MESVIIRAAIIYLFIFVVLRISGKRTLAEMTSFDFVLLLIISESTQQALLGHDSSILGGMIVITTLVFLDIIFSLVTNKWKKADKILNGVPMFLVENGTVHEDRMKKERIQMQEILEAGRKRFGLESLDEIKSAVLEVDGTISIIPKFKDQLQNYAKDTLK
jgi:uncharacterized membrane protein YcaP (DUF421 family)